MTDVFIVLSRFIPYSFSLLFMFCRYSGWWGVEFKERFQMDNSKFIFFNLRLLLYVKNNNNIILEEGQFNKSLFNKAYLYTIIMLNNSL